ncbi:MAG: uracil-DNA glycosylase [Pseudomonadota bacterium]
MTQASLLAKDTVKVKIASGWQNHLEAEFNKDYFQNLIEFVRRERQTCDVYPPAKYYFNAFEKCSFDDVKVIILGQDPYHGPGQAHGLSFSVPDGIKTPPSLQNIFKEIEDDLGIKTQNSGNLERWARQGVLLLNATLTVRARTAGSHQNKGWEEFTDAVIKLISDEKENVVFLLWGSYAQKKGQVIDTNKHLVLTSAHPSPFSVHRGFFGNKHFSQANQYLQNHGLNIIDWA